MRRVIICMLVLVSLLLSGTISVHPPDQPTSSVEAPHLGAWPHTTALPLHSSQPISPFVSSPPSVAYVANSSSLAHWQRKLATDVDVTRLRDLLTTLTSYSCRHPFVSDGNASLTYITSQLTSMGVSYVNDWFPILKVTWTGIVWLRQHFWTRNLYVTPWGINDSAPSLVITSHTDSARYTLLGLSTSDAPGANDNAAGVAAMLEALQLLTELNGSFQRWNIIFAFLGGEEGNGTQSLWGSNHLVANGFSLLGLNPATTQILNIDEIAYKGTLWPTQLALYHFPETTPTTLLTPLLKAATALGFPLQDMNHPRASTLEEVQNDQGWSISEWAFQIHSVPTLTLSTSQFPDPYKHTLYDTIAYCSETNIENTTALIAALVLALAYQLPINPPNHASDWISTLTSVANLTLTDYLDPDLRSYDALVLDPLLQLDLFIPQQITSLSLPLLGLGAAGAQLVSSLTGATMTSQGTQNLQVQGLKAFHPTIGSPFLLSGDQAQLFYHHSAVYAVSRIPEALELVTDENSASMSYLPASLTQVPILFLGVQQPIDAASREIACNSLNWLLNPEIEGICLGLDQNNPSVGSSSILYVFLCDLVNWTRHPNCEVDVNITTPFFKTTEIRSLLTNSSGLATTLLLLQHPFPTTITAWSPQEMFRTIIFSAEPVCSTNIDHQSSIRQGEHLSVYCHINSSLDYTAQVNLTLSHPKVGTVLKSNLLMVTGKNIFHLNLEVLPNCLPDAFNLTLLVSTPELVLCTNQSSLLVEVAFVMSVVAIPEKTVQNQPFEVIISLTNLGSQSRVFDLLAESNFQGTTKVIVRPNETRFVGIIVEYIPIAVMDVGIRLLPVALFIGTHRVMSVETYLYIGYSIINMFITLLPFMFLAALCIIGIWWLRNGKQAPRARSPSTMGFRQLNLPRHTRSTEISWGTVTGQQETHSYPITPQLQEHLNQVIQQLGLTTTAPNRVANDRIILAWEKQGTELHIILQADDLQLVRRVVRILTDDPNPNTLDGDNKDA